MTHPSSPAETLQAAIDSIESDLAQVAYRAPETMGPKLNRAVEILRAQRAILTEAHGYATDWAHGRNTTRGHTPEAIYAKELTLARAILGPREPTTTTNGAI